MDSPTHERRKERKKLCRVGVVTCTKILSVAVVGLPFVEGGCCAFREGESPEAVGKFPFLEMWPVSRNWSISDRATFDNVG